VFIYNASLKIICSFLVNMHYAFQDRENLYLVIDLMNGGDLRYHFAKFKKFSEEQTSKSFYLFYLNLFRVFHCMHDAKSRIPTQQEHPS
jgi:serine/threonine protein kinase